MEKDKQLLLDIHDMIRNFLCQEKQAELLYSLFNTTEEKGEFTIRVEGYAFNVRVIREYKNDLTKSQ